MQRTFIVIATLFLILPLAALGGEIRGKIYAGSNPIGEDIPVEVRFGEKRYTTTTGADGAYRLQVSERGRCVLRLWGRDDLSIAIDSKTKSQKYDLKVVKQGNKYVLRLRED